MSLGDTHIDDVILTRMRKLVGELIDIKEDLGLQPPCELEKYPVLC